MVYCIMCLQVLQHLMDGLISFTFKREDLQCTLFRYIVRELLACAVMRPVLNLASPRYSSSSLIHVSVCFHAVKSLFYFLVTGLLMKELNSWL